MTLDFMFYSRELIGKSSEVARLLEEAKREYEREKIDIKSRARMETVKALEATFHHLQKSRCIVID